MPLLAHILVVLGAALAQDRGPRPDGVAEASVQNRLVLDTTESGQDIQCQKFKGWVGKPKQPCLNANTPSKESLFFFRTSVWPERGLSLKFLSQ